MRRDKTLALINTGTCPRQPPSDTTNTTQTHPSSKADAQTITASSAAHRPAELSQVATIIIDSSNKQMGLQSNDGAVTISSIALLQQRFRELERIREKREERLLQLLVPRPAAAPRETPVKWFFHPELLYPCRPLRDTAAALFPAAPPSSAASECKTFQLRRDQLALGLVAGELWPSNAYKSDVDVDTSLHL